jgi:hypothetical protein
MPPPPLADGALVNTGLDDVLPVHAPLPVVDNVLDGDDG